MGRIKTSIIIMHKYLEGGAYVNANFELAFDTKF